MNRRIREYASEAESKICETIYQYDKRGAVIRMINPMEEERNYTYNSGDPIKKL